MAKLANAQRLGRCFMQVRILSGPPNFWRLDVEDSPKFCTKCGGVFVKYYGYTHKNWYNYYETISEYHCINNKWYQWFDHHDRYLVAKNLGPRFDPDTGKRNPLVP